MNVICSFGSAIICRLARFAVYVAFIASKAQTGGEAAASRKCMVQTPFSEKK